MSDPKAWPFPTSASQAPAVAPAPMPLPWEDFPPAPEGLMEALDKFSVKGPPLYLVHKTSGNEYRVLEWADGRAKLQGPMSMILRPVITAREAAQYTPVWRPA